MSLAGFGPSQIRYDMFDLVKSAEEARRLDKCERIYHRGQDMAWDGREILPMLIKQHGGEARGAQEGVRHHPLG